MGTRVTVSGQGDVRRAAAQCRAEARTFQRNMVAGAAAGARLLKPAIKTAIPQFMPSGYAPILEKTLSVTATTRATGVRIKVLARGKSELRDINARNLGSLRHPVWRRYRQRPDGSWQRNPWVDQKVKPGVVDVPFDATKPKIIQAVDDALGDVAQRIERG